ncbi:methyl-accepting chemotaxis protein [Rhodohalobacter barkolensis]|uniref:Methyl-accepting transducer domain-containing protein n=1 Tax=Rhodohalobacter barkolensis TaxID=2053187 RepID=A0A2N0VL70_9BACT|nr:methyl-accepting chemotaxis protein [Rhodohalobacter barkolensis]PKD44914.1 hypothetical protein CWD77_05495 [Rhodohalobacter barkolensis]
MNSTSLNLFPSLDQALPSFAKDSLHETFVQSDKFMLKLLVLHWILASTIIAFSYSTYILGFVGGGMITGLAYLAYRSNPGSLISRITMGAAFMAFSMLFIQQHFGRIEMHFHIFVSMAFLIKYKDISPILSAAATIAIHHAIFNIAQDSELMIAGNPIMIFDYGCGWDIVGLHASFVVAATLVYSSIILNLTQEYIGNLEVFNIIDQLEDSANHTSEAADFISESGQNLALHANENSVSIAQSHASLKKMGDDILNLSDKTSSAKLKIEEINRETVNLNQSMNELENSSSDIRSVVETIESIASQTNLLALNAAIEAARAGEAGAGFAVVTEEVRVLAKKTSEAAYGIAEIIESNIGKAKGGGMIANDITGKISELNEWIANVHEVSNQQISGVEELKNISSELDITTRKTAETAEKNASTAEQLQGQVHMLKSVVQDLNQKTQISNKRLN